MLRLLVLALALANVGYFLWSQGALTLLGLGPVNQSEAFRLAQQIHPEAIRLLPGTSGASVPAILSASSAASSAAAPPPGPADLDRPAAPATTASATASAAAKAASTAPASAARAPAASAPLPSTVPIASAASSAEATSAAPGECLQAGVFSDVQANALRARLQASLPDGRWALNPVLEPARWIIYMGRYANEDMVVKKRSELRARGVSFEAVQNPGLNPGLSLGHFETKGDADRELAKDAERGVRTARVIQERAELRGHRLVVPNADAPLKTQLAAVKPLLAGKALTACR